MATADPGLEFAAFVRSRLDTSMARAGLPLNDVHRGEKPSLGMTTSVLYEGLVGEFLERYPGLDPVWDQQWREQRDGCVDLWLGYHEEDDSISVHLEHWDLIVLARRYGDESAVAEVEAALSGPGGMVDRVEVVARLLEKALSVARTQERGA